MGLMADVAELERRADLDKYLKDNPLARLGYMLANERPVFYPDTDKKFTSRAWSRAGGGGLEGSRIMPPYELELYNKAHPRDGGFLPANAVVYDSSYAKLPVLAHEYGHIGYGFLKDQGVLPQKPMDVVRPAAEEALIELTEQPFLDDRMNFSKRHHELAGRSYTLKDTQDATRNGGLRGYFGRSRDRLEDHLADIQTVAQGELTRRGEPPRTVPRVPSKGFFDWLFGG